MRSMLPRASETEPSHGDASASLAPKTSVTACNSSAAGADWGLVIWACVADSRQRRRATAVKTQAVRTSARVNMTGMLRKSKRKVKRSKGKNQKAKIKKTDLHTKEQHTDAPSSPA